jgi:hypothetical protein
MKKQAVACQSSRLAGISKKWLTKTGVSLTDGLDEKAEETWQWQRQYSQLLDAIPRSPPSRPPQSLLGGGRALEGESNDRAFADICDLAIRRSNHHRTA